LNPAVGTATFITPSIGATTEYTASRPALEQPVSVIPVARLAVPE
jgi:hypothetical protein